MKSLTRIVSAAALATALATAGCDRNPDAGSGNAQAIALPMLPATLPLETGASNPISFAPSASDLPDAPELKYARVADPDQAYGYADAAYSYDNALGDAPPDYAFDYDDVDPWAWQGYDNSVMIAEPIDDGYRYYYYRPGAEQPYFVRDPWYSYGYSDGMLAAVYAADGGIVAYGDYGPRAIYASRYYSRGRQLWGASRQGRRPVIASAWLRRGPLIAASLTRWGEGRSRQPAWRAFAASDGPRQARYWQAERTRRDADSRRFADWRQSGFRAAPPPRAIPAAWQAASWAKDQNRYRAAATTEQRGGRGNNRDDEGRSDRLDDRRDARADRRDDREQGVGRQERREEAQAARAERRDDRQPQAGSRPGRQDDRGVDRRGDQRPGRDNDQQAQQRARVDRQQAQAERRAERTERQPDDRPDRRETRRPDRQSFERPDRPQVQRPERREVERPNRPERPERQQFERPDRSQAQRPERQQPDRGQRQQQFEAERMQRQQAAQAQRQAEQGQRQQAMQAQRQAAQAQQRQAEQAQRQQQMQAQRQAEQAQRQQAAQAGRQQQQQQRQEQRQERRENRRGPN